MDGVKRYFGSLCYPPQRVIMLFDDMDKSPGSIMNSILLKRLYTRQRGTAIVIQDGKVLLVRDRGKRTFSLPGGGIKKGERAAWAVARELYEELGLKALNIQRLRECDFKGSLNRHRVCIVTEIAGEFSLQGDELDEFMWWDMNEPVPVYTHVKNILASLPSHYRHLVPGIEGASALQAG